MYLWPLISLWLQSLPELYFNPLSIQDSFYQVFPSVAITIIDCYKSVSFGIQPLKGAFLTQRLGWVSWKQLDLHSSLYFSRLNGSVSSIPDFCDAVGFTILSPAFSTLPQGPRVFPGALLPFALPCVCPKGYLTNPLPALPLHYPLLLFSLWRPSFHLGFRNISVQHPFLWWFQVLTRNHRMT